MDKKKIFGISNREDLIGLVVKKDDSYYSFLFFLLKNLDIPIPDNQDYMGNDPIIMEEIDKSSIYQSGQQRVIEVIGKDRVFLFISTYDREKLTNFIMQNCVFIKDKNETTNR